MSGPRTATGPLGQMPIDQPLGTGERTADARLARIHLRGGLLALARAELEQMAGAGALDLEALADLAEARWRSGDLSGAGEAARAHMDAGGEEPLAVLIRVEELDAAGHLIDARALAARVLERVGGQVDRLFAGESRSSAWSTVGSAVGPRPTPLAPGVVAWGGLVGGREVYDPDPSSWAASAVPFDEASLGPPGTATAAQVHESPLDPTVTSGPPGSMGDLVEAGLAAGRAIESVEEAIAAGVLDGVAERLGLLLRRDRALAPLILARADEALESGDPADTLVAALHIVRGDAYRALAREAEANDAYQLSMRALTAGTRAKEST